MRAALHLPTTAFHVCRVLTGALVWGVAESIALARSRRRSVR